MHWSNFCKILFAAGSWSIHLLELHCLKFLWSKMKKKSMLCRWAISPFRLYLNSNSLVIDQIEFVDFILCIANMKSHGTGWYSLCWCAHIDSGLVRADSAHAQNVRTAIWICCEAHAKWLCLKFIVIIKFCKFCNLEYPLITEQVFYGVWACKQHACDTLCSSVYSLGVAMMFCSSADQRESNESTLCWANLFSLIFFMNSKVKVAFGYCLGMEKTDSVDKGDMSPYIVCFCFESTKIQSKIILETNLFYVSIFAFSTNHVSISTVSIS